MKIILAGILVYGTLVGSVIFISWFLYDTVKDFIKNFKRVLAMED